MRNPFEVASSLAASIAGQGRGIRVSAAGRQPKEMLELYEMENCPYCRVVREALTDLDLDAMIYPCPKGGSRFRPLVEKLGGKTQFPFLYDPNTDVSLYESADILEYLYDTYGSRPAPGFWAIKAVRTPAAFSATVLRRGAGIKARRGRDPEKPLVLYSFEASPFARPVREKLCELEIGYELRQMGRTEPEDWMLPVMRRRFGIDYRPTQRNRRELLRRAGRVAVPYLIDPNTGAELFESRSILAYLEREYGEG